MLKYTVYYEYEPRGQPTGHLHRSHFWADDKAHAEEQFWDEVGAHDDNQINEINILSIDIDSSVFIDFK